MSEETGTDVSPLIVDVDGFEGPLDLLVDLARRQKIDLSKISILALTEQYLSYIQDLQKIQLQVAAEYLVMAAWLAFLKSQLLLPKEEREEPDAEELAEELAARLKKIDALRRAGEDLLRRPVLGLERFVRGAPEEPDVITHYRITARLGGLLAAYSSLMARNKTGALVVEPRKIVSVETALERLSKLLTGETWQTLEQFLPENLKPGLNYRSALSSALLASLELAKQGVADIEQDQPFGPIRIRRMKDDRLSDQQKAGNS